MKKIRSRLNREVLFIFILTAPFFGLSALNGSDDLPEWLLLEKGRQAVIDRELGDALQIFRTIQSKASEENRFVPEADMWIGYIFEQEGETEIAITQYERALEHQDSLYIEEDKFTILYRMANIYESIYQYGKYEQILKRIINEGSSSRQGPDTSLIYQQEAMFNVLLRDGIDKLFILYRKDERKLQPAYSQLGLYHYRTGLYRESVRNYIASLITPVTNVIAYQRDKEFTYQYTNLEDFLQENLNDPLMAAYLQEVGVIKDLYYLGASLYAMGSNGPARYIWLALLHGSPNSVWRDRANRQLTEPFIEQLLTPSNYE